MYKLKIMNYQPYEYELLQQLLEDMSHAGYETKSIHFLTLFKKTTKQYHYIVDLFQGEGQSHYDKRISKERFLDSYIDKDYQIIYCHKGMYVFKGEMEPTTIKWEKKKNFVTNKRLSQSWIYFITALIISFLFISNTLTNITFDSFLSYGSLILYIGLLLLCCTLIYYFGLNAYYFVRFKKQLLEKQHYLKTQILKKHHYIKNTLIMICSCLILIGLVEDLFNQKNITLQDHPIMTLQDLQINQSTQTQYKKQSGFQISEYYHYLEYTDDENYILNIKEYTFSSQTRAQKIWNDFESDPSVYQCDTIEENNNIIYGYAEKKRNCIIIQKNNSIYFVSTNFHINEIQTQTIINQYQ